MRLISPYFRLAAIGISFVASSVAVQTAHNPRSSRSAAVDRDTNQLYRNSEFGFTFRIPFGWVDRTKDLGRSSESAADLAEKSDSSKATAKATTKEDPRVLLGIFERPPEVTSDSVNSAVVVASEKTAAYPGLKKAEDYVGPLAEVASAQGFRMEGEAYPITVEARRLIRVDFVKSLGVKSRDSDPAGDKIEMRQSTLVWISGKNILSFTFIAGSEEGLDEMMDGLHFIAEKSQH